MLDFLFKSSFRPVKTNLHDKKLMGMQSTCCFVPKEVRIMYPRLTTKSGVWFEALLKLRFLNSLFPGLMHKESTATTTNFGKRVKRLR